MSRTFEWDERKAASNAAKHGTTFEEARTVFDDPLAKNFVDDSHSTDERREIIIGHSSTNRVLVVSYTERPPRIRIISVRAASRNEQRKYEEN